MQTKIYKFDPVIYPFPLLVCKFIPDVTGDELCSRFYVLEDARNIREATTEFSASPTWVARTIPVVDKQTEQMYYLINLIRPDALTAGTLAHEAGHVAVGLGNIMGFGPISVSNDELYMYYIGWVADCVDSVCKDEPKSMNGELYK